MSCTWFRRQSIRVGLCGFAAVMSTRPGHAMSRSPSLHNSAAIPEIAALSH